MRLRWIFVLSALVLKVCLVGAILLLGRYVLERNYQELEHEHIEADLEHLSQLIQSQASDLNLVALDYAERDATYDVMLHPNPNHGRAQLTPATFRTRQIALCLLLDRSGRLVLAKSFNDDSQPVDSADIDELIRAAGRRFSEQAVVAGLINVTEGPALVAMRPILPSGGVGVPRGTLIMMRLLAEPQTAQLSRLSNVPVSLSGTMQESAQVGGGPLFSDSSITVIPLDEDRVLGTVMLNDVWRQPHVRLQIEHPREIWQHGEQTIRALVVVLVLGGLLSVAVTLWVMEKFVIRRVERLIRLVRNIDGEGGLSARIRVRGSDEFAQLGLHLNAMLERLQNSQDKIAAAQERLRFEATHDALTGIWNRGAALRLLDAELDRASRDGTSVAVILFDADHFKRINDSFGHATGDRTLQSVAAAITSSLRSSDVCCRYGGEEFLVIAPNCNLEQGVQLARRVLQCCCATPVTLPDQAFCVTLSAGVTATTWRCSGDDLILVADRALYRAKEAGRNRVEAEDVPSRQSIRSVRFAPDELAAPVTDELPPKTA